jgi:DNA polymerase-1
MSKKNNAYDKRLVLLDTNAIMHRGYHALPDFETSDGTPTGALYGLCLMLLSTIDDLNPDEIIACFDRPEPTHRHEKFEDYKAHRPDTDEELVTQIKKAHDVLDAFAIPHYELEGFEADDLLGTIAEKMKDKKDTQVVISSGDHDTLQLVDGKKTLVYTQRRGLKDTVLYDEDGVQEKYGFAPEYIPDFKGLMGDSSDNIPGIKGVGEKTATRVIKNFGHLEEAYEKLTDDGVDFANAGISSRFADKIKDGKDAAMFSKELATIRLDADIDFTFPETPWKDRLDKEKISTLFDQLEFNSLSRRVDRELFSGSDDENEHSEDTKKPETNNLSEKQKAELKIALWLCDSTKTDPTIDDITTYTDTDNLQKAKTKLTEEMKEKGVYSVFTDIEKPLIPIVNKMETNGVRLDQEYLAELSEEYHGRLEKLRDQIHEEAGTEFNVNSPQQLSEVMFEEMEIPTTGLAKTSTGNISTKESELKKLADEHDIASLVLDYRHVQKLVSTYIDVLQERISDDGRLHAEFVQAGTTTGRMSSKNPNLQNIPVRSEDGKKIRGAFVPAEGYTLAALDYSQIELRIAAWLSEDEKLTEIFQEGKDVHAETAGYMFKKEPADVSKAERDKAKVINYGILYGMGVNALKDNLGDDTTKAEAQQYLDDYLDTYEGLAEFMEAKKQEVRSQGYTTTYFGRRRYFPEIYSSRSHVQARAEREAINAPIQGTQADIIKRAMVDIDNELAADAGDDIRLLLQVHDELIYEVDEGKADEYTKQIKDLMEDVVSPEDAGGIEMIADASIGNRWNNL